MKEIIIDLEEVNSDRIVKEYEKYGKNYIRVDVQLPNGEMLPSLDTRVYLTMSRDAMHSLALNLLSQVYNPDVRRKDNKMWEWFPAYENGILDVMGVAMHPKSCELKLFQDDECDSIYKLVGQKDPFAKD